MINGPSLHKLLRTPVGYAAVIIGVGAIGWASNKWCFQPIMKHRKQKVLNENAEYIYTQMKLQEERKRQEIFS